MSLAIVIVQTICVCLLFSVSSAKKLLSKRNVEGSNSRSAPWNAAIYMKNEDGKYEHICGGTLILPNVVVSATKCFKDFNQNRIDNLMSYKIAVGKQNRNYYDTNEKEDAQVIDIAKFNVPTIFGRTDIIVLILSEVITFTEDIRPAFCKWAEEKPNEILVDKAGVIAGWRPESESSESEEASGSELEVVRVEMLDKSTCKAKRPEINNDIFCAQLTGSSKLYGDYIGSGFIVQEQIKDKTYNFIQGVVVGNRSEDFDDKGSSSHKRNIILLSNLRWNDSFLGPD